MELAREFMREEEYRNQVLVGNIVDVIKQLPFGCFYSVNTSPPYWKARNYGPFYAIWDIDPANPDCVHDWLEIKADRPPTKGDVPGPNSKVARHRPPEVNCPGVATKVCTKCGAWYGPLGQEPTPELYITHLCDIAELLFEKMPPDGTQWWNVGEKYNGSGGAGNQDTKYRRAARHTQFKAVVDMEGQSYPVRVKNIPGQSIIGILHKFPEEMLKRGWQVIQVLVWHKPGCMTESTVKRFTIDYELIYIFARPGKPLYYVNAETGLMQREKPLGTKGIEGVDWHWSIKEVDGEVKHTKVTNWIPFPYYFNQQLVKQKTKHVGKTGIKFGGNKATSGGYGKGTYSSKEWIAIGDANKRATWTVDGELVLVDARYVELLEALASAGNDEERALLLDGWREAGSVMHVNPRGTSLKHFAPMPVALARAMIEPSTPKEICTCCGLPRVHLPRKGMWSKCKCPEPTYGPGAMLDPFGGAGSGGVAALETGRDFILVEINPRYARMARKRIFKVRKALKAHASLDAFTGASKMPGVLEKFVEGCEHD